MIFDNSIHYEELPASDSELKMFLNYNPVHNSYTRKQKIPGRNPDETDRGGWRGYDRVYSKYFKDLRLEKLNIMEIGINEGYGIYAWQRYFSNSTIYGIDNNWKTSIIEKRNNIKEKHPLFRKAKLYDIDSTNSDHWLQFYGKKFDIIIDDGDHNPISQIQTFKCAWKYLKSDGLYFIEDIGHRYGKNILKDLSDTIVSCKHEFANMDIYYHINTGLKKVLQNEYYINKYNVKNTNVSHKEYIVAIRKK
jgi:hypothetical protein